MVSIDTLYEERKIRTLSCSTLSNAWIMRVECHQSGGLMESATAAEEAPLLA